TQMPSIRMIRKSQAMILIFALWILAILSVFALSISAGIRQKMMLVKRLENRERLHLIAVAGIQAARGVLYMDRIKAASNRCETVSGRKLKLNNPEVFETISVNGGEVSVSYREYDTDLTRPKVIYGLQDELGKLNINTASRSEIALLFMIVAGLSEDTAEGLANAIIDWRSHADQSIQGFYGDDYYLSLNFPYKPKKGPLEIIEEVLLVKGMNPAIFSRLYDFITVYGDGKVNINTASRAVLTALGMGPDVINLIINYRNGPDKILGTDDDFVFQDDGVSIHVGGLGDLPPDQLAQIDSLYVRNRICTYSQVYHVRARARLNKKETHLIRCVVNGTNGRILSWREGLSIQ
ncbi:MAG TPA: hypothetical protein VLJ10_03255, partial [Candidatus Bathyarchaeia archaeon]|nr:hypothetical protein [Candidatus Bathyarchaeia archaeon]